MLKKIHNFLHSANFLCFITAFWSVSVLPYALLVPEPMFLSGSIFSLIIFWGFFLIFRFSFKKFLYMDNNLAIYLFSWFLSSLLVLGRNISLFGKMDFSFPGMIKFLFITTGISFLITIFITNLTELIYNKKIFLILEDSKISQFFKSKVFTKSFIIIFLCWLPVWLCFFPGIYEYDVPYQMEEMVQGKLSNWHPILHTLYLYYSVYAGKTLFHSIQTGVFIYVIFQMIILIAILSYCIHVMQKCKANVSILFFSLLFFGLYPIFPIFAFSTTKDVIWGGGLLLFTVLVVETIITKQKLNPLKIILMFLSVLLFLLFRTNSIIILLFLFVIYLIFERNKYRISEVIFFSVILYFILLFAIYPKLNIEPVKIEEPLSVPLHQISSVMYKYEDFISEKDKIEYYDLLLDNTALSRYHLRNVDYIKNLEYSDWTKRIFNAKKLKENPIEYFNLWKRIFKKYPTEYINAFLNLNVPFWYPDYIYECREHSQNPYISIHNLQDTKYCLKEIIPESRIIYDLFFINYVADLTSKPIYQKNFVTSILFSTALPCWILLFCIFSVMIRKRNNMLLILAIPMVTIVINMFAPTYLLRYNFSIILTLPIMMYIISGTVSEGSKDNTQDNIFK